LLYISISSIVRFNAFSYAWQSAWWNDFDEKYCPKSSREERLLKPQRRSSLCRTSQSPPVQQMQCDALGVTVNSAVPCNQLHSHRQPCCCCHHIPPGQSQRLRYSCLFEVSYISWSFPSTYFYCINSDLQAQNSDHSSSPNRKPSPQIGRQGVRRICTRDWIRSFIAQIREETSLYIYRFRTAAIRMRMNTEQLQRILEFGRILGLQYMIYANDWCTKTAQQNLIMFL